MCVADMSTILHLTRRAQGGHCCWAAQHLMFRLRANIQPQGQTMAMRAAPQGHPQSLKSWSSRVGLFPLARFPSCQTVTGAVQTSFQGLQDSENCDRLAESPDQLGRGACRRRGACLRICPTVHSLSLQNSAWKAAMIGRCQTELCPLVTRAPSLRWEHRAKCTTTANLMSDSRQAAAFAATCSQQRARAE